MPNRQRQRKLEPQRLSLASLLIALMIIAILMASWLVFFRKTHDSVSATNFEMQAKRFNEAVNFVHLAWLQQGKPSQLDVNQLFSNSLLADEEGCCNLNRSGFPIIPNENDKGCEQLWRGLLNAELDSVKHKLFAKYSEQYSDQGIKHSSCRYYFNSKSNIEYVAATGAVMLHHH